MYVSDKWHVLYITCISHNQTQIHGNSTCIIYISKMTSNCKYLRLYLFCPQDLQYMVHPFIRDCFTLYHLQMCHQFKREYNNNKNIKLNSKTAKTKKKHSFSMKTKHLKKKNVRKLRGKKHKSRRLFWLDLERTGQKHPKARRNSWNRQIKTENKKNGYRIGMRWKLPQTRIRFGSYDVFATEENRNKKANK